MHDTALGGDGDRELTPDEQRRALKAERNRLKAMLGDVEESLRALGAPKEGRTE